MTDDLILDVKEFIRRYVVMNDDQLLITAVWVIHTHVISAAVQTPYLAVTSPEKQCGKTRLLETLELLVHEPWMATLPSEATMYRYVDYAHPTMLLDELDTIFNPRLSDRYEGHRAILNSGNRRGAKVPRSVGTSHEMQEFDVFCAKVLAGIGTLPDTVVDRSIPIRLQRRTQDETVERMRRRVVEPLADELRDRCKEWALDHIDDLTDAEPDMPDELTDRQVDGCEILVAIADALGNGDDVRKSLVALFSEPRIDSDAEMKGKLLQDCYRVFEDLPALPSRILAARLNALEDSKWVKWNRGSGITMADIAAILAAYKIKSTTVRFPDETGYKQPVSGYKRSSFEPVWQRYLTEM